MWPALQPEIISRFPHQPANGAYNGKPAKKLSDTENADGWKRCIDKLLELRLYEDDWDGQGAEAPSVGAVDSAIILAVLLREKDIEPPCRTVAIVDGSVVLEWQWPDVTTLEIEVAEPYLADVFLLAPGLPAEHWRIEGSKNVLVEAGAHEAGS